MLSMVTGWKVSRVSSSRLTMRGLGVRTVDSLGYASYRGTLLPKRVPTLPIVGCSRSLYVPSTVRAVRERDPCPFEEGEPLPVNLTPVVSYKFFCPIWYEGQSGSQVQSEGEMY